MHDNHPAPLFVALDLSRSSWVAAVHAPHAAGKVSRHKLAPGAEGLLALIERIRAQAERALGAPVRVASCYEAGRDGFWLHRVLQKAGIENRVIDPASLLVDRRARRGKTDRLDAEPLRRGLLALWRGEPGAGGAGRGACGGAGRWAAGSRGSAPWCAPPRSRRRTPGARRGSVPTCSRS